MPHRATSPAAIVLTLLAVVAAGCMPGGPLGGPQATKDPIAGIYIARGGGGALESVTALTRAFSKLHPGIIWQGLDDLGSDAGIKLVRSGDLDLSFISRELKSSETGVETLPIGATGTGVAVASSRNVTALTKDQLGKIFRGEIADWSQVGGNAGLIRVLMREAGAATRMGFEAFCFGGKPAGGYAKNTIEVTSYEETLNAIKSFSGSTGIMSMTAQAFAEPAIRLVSIDGVAATRETLNDGTYPMRRPLYLVFSSDPTKVNPGIRAFLEWVKGPDGQQLLAGL